MWNDEEAREVPGYGARGGLNPLSAVSDQLFSLRDRWPAERIAES